MNSIFIILLLAVIPAMAYAGDGTIHETESQIIVEYSGDASEVAAANLANEKEERLKEQEAKIKEKESERVKTLAENHVKKKEQRRDRHDEVNED